MIRRFANLILDEPRPDVQALEKGSAWNPDLMKLPELAHPDLLMKFLRNLSTSVAAITHTLNHNL